MISTKQTALGATSPIMKLNEEEFLLVLNGTHLMKYNTVEHTWTLLHQLPDCARASMTIDRKLKKIYILTDRSLLELDLLSGSMICKQARSSCSCEDYTLLVVNEILHRIGGQYDHHVTWNRERGKWNDNVIQRFPCEYLQDVSLVHVKSKNIILLIGGSSLYHTENRDLGIWRFHIATSKWEEVKGVNAAGESYSILTPDEHHVIIVDRYGIQVMNIQDEDRYQMMHSILLKPPTVPHKLSRGYPVLMNEAIDVFQISSNWFRKLFGQALCPVVLLHLIDEFVCRQKLHLISRGYESKGLAHVVFDLVDVLSSADAKARELPEVQMKVTSKDFLISEEI